MNSRALAAADPAVGGYCSQKRALEADIKYPSEAADLTLLSCGSAKVVCVVVWRFPPQQVGLGMGFEHDKVNTFCSFSYIPTLASPDCLTCAEGDLVP